MQRKEGRGLGAPRGFPRKVQARASPRPALVQCKRSRSFSAAKHLGNASTHVDEETEPESADKPVLTPRSAVRVMLGAGVGGVAVPSHPT